MRHTWAEIYDITIAGLARGRLFLTGFVIALEVPAIILLFVALSWQRSWLGMGFIALLVWLVFAGAAGYFIQAYQTIRPYVLKGILTDQIHRGREAIRNGDRPGHFLCLDVEDAFYINKYGEGERLPGRLESDEWLTNGVIYDALQTRSKPLPVTLVALRRDEVVALVESDRLIMANGAKKLRGLPY